MTSLSGRLRDRRALPALQLSVKRATFRMDDADHKAADAEFKARRQRVLQRAGYTCHYCGFRSKKWQEVHHLNDDHHDNRPENLVCICSYCHAVFHIGRAGIMGEAHLAWLPHFTQVEVNHLCRTLYVLETMLRERDDPHQDEDGDYTQTGYLQLLVDNLKTTLGLYPYTRQGIARARCRERIGTDDPASLGSVLADMNERAYEKRMRELAPVRLVPQPARYIEGQNVHPKMVTAWLSDAYAGLPPDTWPQFLTNDLMRQIKTTVQENLRQTYG